MMIIALDIGDKRVGVAIADQETKIARPLTTVPNNRQLMHELQTLQDEHGFTQIVVGLPITLSGHEGAQARKTIELTNKIKVQLSVDIVFEDERMTSRDAHNRLKDIPHSRSEVDAVSASLILDSWLAKQEKS